MLREKVHGYHGAYPELRQIWEEVQTKDNAIDESYPSDKSDVDIKENERRMLELCRGDYTQHLRAKGDELWQSYGGLSEDEDYKELWYDDQDDRCIADKAACLLHSLVFVDCLLLLHRCYLQQQMRAVNMRLLSTLCILL